jgi:hypothetical protein
VIRPRIASEFASFVQEERDIPPPKVRILISHQSESGVGSDSNRARRDYRKAGVPRRLPHDLRRTAVRNLERAGVARSAAMNMVGHRTESIYRSYAIADEAMLKEGAVKLAAFHASEKNGGRKVVPLKKRRADVTKEKHRSTHVEYLTLLRPAVKASLPPCRYPIRNLVSAAV